MLQSQSRRKISITKYDPDNNIKINVALASKAPIGVDTEEDYLALKKIMEYKS